MIPVIPADHIHFNDDGTACLVFTHDVLRDSAFQWDALDRPCDTCRGTKLRYTESPDGSEHYLGPGACPDCIDGRHAFTIEVAFPYTAWEMGCTRAEVEQVGGTWPTHQRWFRVSIVPGMVLPIVHNDDTPMLDGARFVEMWDDRNAVAWDDGKNAGIFTLPPVARPGMWAVKLQVAS